MQQDFMTALGLAIVSAKSAWQDSKRRGGRPRGRRGDRNVSGDAYFLGIVGGLQEARVLFQKCQGRVPVMRSSGALRRQEELCQTTGTRR